MTFQVGLSACEQQTTSRPLTRSRSPLVGPQPSVNCGACASCHGTCLTWNWMVVNRPQFLSENPVWHLHSGSHRQLGRRPGHRLQLLGPKCVGVPKQNGAISVSTLISVAG